MFQKLIERLRFWNKSSGLRLWTSSVGHPGQRALAFASVQKTYLYWTGLGIIFQSQLLLVGADRMQVGAAECRFTRNYLWFEGAVSRS